MDALELLLLPVADRYINRTRPRKAASRWLGLDVLSISKACRLVGRAGGRAGGCTAARYQIHGNGAGVCVSADNRSRANRCVYAMCTWNLVGGGDLEGLSARTETAELRSSDGVCVFPYLREVFFDAVVLVGCVYAPCALGKRRKRRHG